MAYARTWRGPVGEQATPTFTSVLPQSYNCRAYDHVKRDCPDKHIPKEELPRWRQVRARAQLCLQVNDSVRVLFT